MYKNVGFEIVRGNEEDYIMLCKLQWTENQVFKCGLSGGEIMNRLFFGVVDMESDDIQRMAKE